MLNGLRRNANKSGNVCRRSARSRYSGHETPGYPPPSVRASIRWRRVTLVAPGSGCSISAWIHEKIAVLTPIPTPSDSTTTVANTGARLIVRQLWRTSRRICVTLRLQALGFGLWALGFGLRALGYGLWATGFRRGHAFFLKPKAQSLKPVHRLP